MTCLPPTVLQSLKSRFPNEILSETADHTRTILTIQAQALSSLALTLKLEFGFTQLQDIIAIDWQDKKPARFELQYLLYNITAKTRLTLKVALPHNTLPSIASLSHVHLAANWQERECFDMMGIHFEGHPNLKRLLMWENFIGHPLRKDYPLNHRQPIPVQQDLV